jgi:hypothetical protein
MSGTQVGGLAIQIVDATGNLIARNAQGKEGNRMSTEHSLNDNDLKVAHAMGIDPKSVSRLKYRFGKGGLSGVALLSKDTSSPYGTPSPNYKPTDPGDIDDDDSSAEADELPDPAGIVGQPAGVRFPNGSSSKSKRKKIKVK